MAYRIEVTNAARRAMAKLPADVLKRIDAKILSLADNPRPQGVEKLTSTEKIYRVRVGDYRIVYYIDDGVLVVTVVKVAHRREVYR